MSESERPEPRGGWVEALGEEGTNPPEPRTNGETLFALGREWKVASFENRLKAQFEQWLRRRAKQEILNTEIEDGPEEAAKMRSAYLADLGAGLYTWDGRHGRTARGDLPGLQYVLFLALHRCQPEVTQDQVEEMFEENAINCGLALRWILGKSKAPAGTATPTGPKAAVSLEELERAMLALTKKMQQAVATPTTLDSP